MPLVGKKNTTEGEIYTSCFELPLKRFIKCVCDGNMKALNMRGASAPLPLLQDAWVKIYAEYVELMNKGNSTVEVMLAYDIERMGYRYISITKGLELLRHTRDDEIVAMIKREGFFYEFNPDERDKYLRDILKAEKRAMSIEVEIQTKRDLLKQLIGEKGEGEQVKIDQQYFVSNLVTLSKFNGYRVSDEITVAEYVTLVNNFIDHQEQQKSKQNGGRAD